MPHTTGGIGINYNFGNYVHQCVCCSRNMGLPTGDRGLCDGCDEDIPRYIPKEQYLAYMKELWSKK